MNKDFVLKMIEKYHEYRNSTEQIDLKRRLVENEKWFRRKQSEMQPKFNSGENKRVPTIHGGYVFNAIITKHADAMDNYPDVNILAREESDVKLAQTLTGVIPYILERNDFESVYSDNWYSKLKTSSCYSVIWDQDANDGEGEVKITKADLINLFWQPNISDIQHSEFVFCHSYLPKKAFIDTYGLDKLVGAEYITHIDTYEALKFQLKDEFVLIIDCYYKKKNKAGKTCLHFAKITGTSVLFSSEDEHFEDGKPSYPNGYYEDGEYPFVFDVMYPTEQCIAGFGVVDAIKDIQAYIDSLDTMLQVNNQIVGKPRYLISNDLNISNADLMDLTKDVIKFNGSVNNEKFMKLPIDTLPRQIEDSLQRKADELKEIIGNREFQQGGTQKGVVSGTAISILQASGDKLSRDIIKESYRRYKKIILLVIERVRQFYDDARTMRIIGKDGEESYIEFSNAQLKGFDDMMPSMDYRGDLGVDVNAPMGVQSPQFGTGSNRSLPMFDVKLTVQKSNPYSRELNNQTIIELAKLGLLNPEMFEVNLPVLNALQFDGKDAIIKDLREVSDKFKSAAQEQQQALIQSQMQTSSGAPEGMTPGMDMAMPPAGGEELVDVTEMLQM